MVRRLFYFGWIEERIMAERKLSEEEIRDIIAGLSPEAEGLYYFLPNTCWMTEKTMAKALKTHTRIISSAKKELEAKGLIEVQRESNNFKRVSEIHRIIKVPYSGLHLIQEEEWGWVLRERERVISSGIIESQTESNDLQVEIDTQNKKSLIAVPENFVVSMNWELLKRYSAGEINRMGKAEQAELYMEVGFLVVPTHYPIFGTEGEIVCSCKVELCGSVGKHPYVQSFKKLTPETYQKKRAGYLKRFKRDKNLNIGFKPYGYSVLDVDYRNNGAISLGLLREEVSGLDETLSVASPNGEHLYTSTVGLNQSVGLLGEGLDVRSDKTTGFIVAPGSLHKSGKEYQWSSIGDLEEIPGEWLNVNDSPVVVSLAERVRKKTGRNLKEIKIPSHVYPGYSIPEGQRYNTLFKFACRERGRGAGAEHIYDVLSTIRDTYCEESKDSRDAVTDAELLNIAETVVRYPTNAEKLRERIAA
jgi:hypothetical protein